MVEINIVGFHLIQFTSGNQGFYKQGVELYYEMEVMANNYEWLVHSTDMFPVGTEVSIHVDPFDIQIMKKPESEDEEAVNIEE